MALEYLFKQIKPRNLAFSTHKLKVNLFQCINVNVEPTKEIP